MAHIVFNYMQHPGSYPTYNGDGTVSSQQTMASTPIQLWLEYEDAKRIQEMLGRGEIKGNSMIPIKQGTTTMWVNMINVAYISFD